MNKRILVADDDARIRLTLRQLLTGKGYEVEEARDGQEALQRIRETRFALIFLDRMMPELSGDEVMAQLPPHFVESTPVVLLTGKDKDQDVMHGYAMGATYYITKPISNQRILDVVDYLAGDVCSDTKDTLVGRL